MVKRAGEPLARGVGVNVIVCERKERADDTQRSRVAAVTKVWCLVMGVFIGASITGLVRGFLVFDSTYLIMRCGFCFLNVFMMNGLEAKPALWVVAVASSMRMESGFVARTGRKI
jgi:hypothetical protein